MIRRYRLDDVDVMVNHIKEDLNNTRYKRIVFVDKKIKDLLIGNINNSQFFCNVGVDGDDKVVAGLCATVVAYIFSYDAIAHDNFFYIQPEHRSMELATALVGSYVTWAKERKVKEILLQNIAGDRPELFEKFARILGFKAIGTYHSMEL